MGLFGRILLLCCVSLLTACQQDRRHPSPTLADHPLRLHETGTIVAAETVEIVAPRSWRALRITWMVSEGTVVAPRDTVTLFDRTELEEWLQQTAADVVAQQKVVASLVTVVSSRRTAAANAIAKAQLAREEAALSLENHRFEAEVARNQAKLAMAQAEIDLRQARGDSAAQAVLDSLEIAGADLKEKRLGERLARFQLYVDQLTVTARTGGMAVLHREHSEEGVTVHRVGDEVQDGAHLLDITDASAMKVEFTAHESDVWRLAPGQSVDVILDAYPEQTFAGVIETVARMPLAAEEGVVVRRFAAKAAINDTSRRLRPGMSARVVIEPGGSDARK